MPEQVFRAPGFYEREIDATTVSVQPTGVPYCVIGAMEKGPAFVPTTVGSFEDFLPRFGTLNARYMAPYSVEKILDSKTALTVIRVLGAGANSTTTDIENTRTKGTVKNAGMQITGTIGSGGDVRHNGAVQFLCAKHIVSSSEAFGFPMFSDNSSYDLAGSAAYLVRGALFTASDTRVMLMDVGETFAPTLDDACSIDNTSTSATYRKFKIVLSSSVGSTFGNDEGNPGVKILTASLNPTSADYIGKVLNTDPEKFDTEKHVLYGDYSVDDEIATVASGSGNTDSVVILSGTTNTSANSGDTSLTFRDMFGRFDTRFKTPRTPSFISQPFGNVEHNLFDVESLDDGAYANKKYKISILNLKASTDPRYDYGSFALLVRDFNDTDLDQKVLEQFNNLTLDPDSEGYIGKVIGDTKARFNFDVDNDDDKRIIVNGSYPIKSKYIRVNISDAVKQKQVPAKSLPFGFRGVEVLNTNSRLVDSGSAGTLPRLGGSGSSFSSRLTGSIVPPIPFRFKITRGEITGSAGFTGEPGPTEVADSRFYWGVKFERNTNAINSNVSNEPNNIIKSFTAFAGLSQLDAVITGSFADTLNDNKFTLSKVCLSGLSLANITSSADAHMREAAYIRNGTVNQTDYSVSDGAFGSRVSLATLLSSGSATDFNRFIDYTKFTTFLYGGWDGVNLFDKNAARFNDRATSTESGSVGFGGASTSYTSPGATTGVNYGGTSKDNNIVASYRSAIDLATDQNVFQGNVIATPGIRDSLVSDYLIDKVQNTHQISFAVIDVPYYDSNGVRIFDGDVGRYVDVNKTADSFESRATDNNSCAAYFPNVVIDDSVNNRRITVPATIAALGALAYNDKVAYPWWAPAGFNRAALNFVQLTQTKINQPERNRLSDVRINPITRFPGEGYVILSQKTLQQANTSLTSINVKRMILEAKRQIVQAGNRIIWEQITPALRDKFTSDATSLLAAIQLKQGIEKFQVICNDTNNTNADVDAYRVNGRIIIKPTKSIEFIDLQFVILPTGTTFSG